MSPPPVVTLMHVRYGILCDVYSLCACQTVESGRHIKCKCHGISGSCDVRTCGSSVPSLRTISNSLRARVDTAVKVRFFGKLNPSTPIVGRRRLKITAVRKTMTSQPATAMSFEASLVYFRSSTDYCPTTAGRVCGGSDYDHCRQTCCGRGYGLRRVEIVDDKCRCRFQFCCRVVCSRCERTTEERVCL